MHQPDPSGSLPHSYINNQHNLVCYPILEPRFDLSKLSKSVDTLFERLGLFNIQYFLGHLNDHPVYTINLTHKPELLGVDRWRKHRGNHLSLQRQGVREIDFTESLEELSGTYLLKAMEAIKEKHLESFGTPFVGRCQIIASRSGHCYPMHRDPHTPHRYHVPLMTDPRCFWIFEDEISFDMMHMPADGRAWYLNPVQVNHTLVHVGQQPRLHILMTSSV